MKKYINYVCICAWILLLGTSCQEQESTSGKSGMLISLVEETQIGVETRATPIEIGKPAFTDFQLRILRHPNETIYDGNYISEKEVPAGTYTLTAYHGNNQLGIDNPYYEGSAIVEVHEGTTPVTIPCKVANALISIKYADQTLIDDIYEKGYAVTITINKESIDLDNTDQSVYFPAGSKVALAFKATLKGESKAKIFPLTHADLPETFQASEHAIITLSAQNLNLSIGRVEVSHTPIAETIPVKWLPTPRIAASGFKDNSLIYYETETPEANLQFTTALGLQELRFRVAFEDETYQTLNGEYTLSTMTEEQKQTFVNAGIILPEIGDKEKGTMDFTNLISKLKGNQTPTVNNVITLQEVTANGKSLDATQLSSYTIGVKKKPVFTVSVDERNVWSKEFTIDEVTISEGDTETIKAGLVYQYSADGGNTWIDCNNGQLQKFETHPQNRNLSVRAKFRDFLSENISIELEEPQQMPNSDMEEWHYTTVARNIITYNPWESSGFSFWNTNNSYTTRYKSSVSILNAGSNPYNCFPAVSYVIGGHSGNKAAEIRSTASGRGNTLPSNVLDLNKIAGELFIGEIEISQGGSAATPKGDHYTIDSNGRNFTSRPTAIHFWYKYAPVTEQPDTWKAYIALMDENHIPIINQELKKSEEEEDWQKAIMTLDYQSNHLYEKCKYIFIVFSSTTTTGKDMQYKDYNNYKLWKDNTLTDFNDTKSWIGSILTIDDISLIYDK